MSPSRKLLAPAALLPSGWARNVLMEVDDGGTLRAVEPSGEGSGARELDGIVVPGIPDLHSHAFQRAMAGLTERAGAEEDDFWSWRETMYAFLERLTPEQVEAIAARLYMEMLRSGYTAVAEFHYLHNDPRGRSYDDPAAMSRALVRAARATGIGITLLPVLYRHGGFGGAPPRGRQSRFVLSMDAFRELLETLASDLEGDPNARLGMALHSLRAVTPEELVTAVEVGRSLDAEIPVHIHAAEQEREVRECVSWSGARPVEWLLDEAPLDHRWCVVHATHMTDAEIRGLAASGAVAGLCPTTEANLGDGVFPLRSYLEAGGAWGVGSDSHVSVSPVEELRLLEYGQRLVHRRRNLAALEAGASTGETLLRGALEGGARACGRPLGRLEPGARADFLVLDSRHADFHARGLEEIADAWLFSGSRSPVRSVMVGGRWVIREGRHPEEDAVRDTYLRVMEELRG